MKRFLFSLLLVTVLLFCSALAETSEGIGATSGTCGANLTWELADGTLTIRGTGSMRNYTSSDGAPWEAVKSSITSLVIESGATSIGDYAFYGCSNLKNTNLPSTVKTIGASSFASCYKIASIELPTNLTSLGADAFNNCDSLRSIVLPSSLEAIGNSSFYSCNLLRQIVFPDGIISIPSAVIAYSSNLEEVVIGENTETIKAWAFEGCTNLTSVTIPETITSVESFAFNNCYSLTDVYFAGTKEQANAISIGTGNTYFTGAVWHCSDGDTEGIGATSGNCGANLTWELADGTLTIRGTGTMRNYTSSGGAPWESVKSSITSLVIESGATSIGDYAFYGCSNLKNTNLPSTVKTIGASSFASCYKIASIELPTNLTSLGADAFNNCDSLRSIVLPSSLEAIGNSSFYSCNLLRQIVFPDGIISIPSAVIAYSSNLEEVVIGENTETIKAWAFEGCTNLTSVTIPETITSVESFAFNNCYSLTDVYFAGTKEQSNAITIGTGNTYFTGATWHFGAGNEEPIENILTLPESLKTIESEAFAGVNAQMIVVPSSVTEIGALAFAGCADLRCLELPAGEISIADDILSGCGDVTVICEPGSPAEQWALRNGYDVSGR